MLTLWIFQKKINVKKKTSGFWYSLNPWLLHFRDFDFVQKIAFLGSPRYFPYMFGSYCCFYSFHHWLAFFPSSMLTADAVFVFAAWWDAFNSSMVTPLVTPSTTLNTSKRSDARNSSDASNRSDDSSNSDSNKSRLENSSGPGTPWREATPTAAGTTRATATVQAAAWMPSAWGHQ